MSDFISTVKVLVVGFELRALGMALRAWSL